jgi:flagellar basal-body rod protein FlgB
MAGLRLFNFSQQLLELSMRVRGARHEILSANIANADTPGYRPRDIDFASTMRTAVEMDDTAAGSREQQMERLLASPLDLQPIVYEPGMTNHQHGEDRLDGNGVSLDRQMALLNENALSYEASLTLFSRTLASLRYAIGEGRR